MKSQNSSNDLILDDCPKCFSSTGFQHCPEGYYTLKHYEVKVLWHAAAPVKASGTRTSLKSALQESEMPPRASDFLLQRLMAPLTDSPPAGLVLCATSRLETHQPSFWFHSSRPPHPLHLFPCCSLPCMLAARLPSSPWTQPQHDHKPNTNCCHQNNRQAHALKLDHIPAHV